MSAGDLADRLAAFVVGSFQQRLQVLDLGAQAAQLGGSARRLGVPVGLRDERGFDHFRLLHLHRFERHLKPHDFLFALGQRGQHFRVLRRLVGVDRRHLVELALCLRLALQRLVEIDRQADLLFPQRLVLARPSFGFDRLGGQRLDGLAEPGFLARTRIGGLDEFQPGRGQGRAKRLVVLRQAGFTLPQIVERGVAFLLLAGRFAELFQQLFLFRRQAEVGQLQLVGAVDVGVENAEEAARQHLRRRHFRELRLDLLQVLLGVAVKLVEGLQRGQPALGVRRQPSRRFGSFGGGQARFLGVGDGRIVLCGLRQFAAEFEADSPSAMLSSSASDIPSCSSSKCVSRLSSFITMAMNLPLRRPTRNGRPGVYVSVT